MLCAAAILLLLFSGCSTGGTAECLEADWFNIGYQDGARGYRSVRIQDQRRLCARYGVRPDADAYEKGRRKGLAQWCTPLNGNRIGLRGGRYNGVCPKTLEPAFLQALDKGRAIYEYEIEWAKQNRRLTRLQADLGGIDKNIRGLESALISRNVSPMRRKALLGEIRLRKEDRRLLLEEISAAEKTLSDMRENLKQLKAENPYK